MYEIENHINNLPFEGLKNTRIGDLMAEEILFFSLEKGHEFKEHISPRDARIMVLEGAVVFHINGKSYALNQYQIFAFPKDVKHWVKATVNAKFMVIR